MYVKVANAQRSNPAHGLGFWPFDSWYTIWDGKKWLPQRYLSSGAALDWRLDQMEKNWNQAVKLYKHSNNAWRPV